MRTVLLSLLIGVLAGLAGESSLAQSGARRDVPPVESWLPAETPFFLSLPNGETALQVLARTGEPRVELARRLGGQARVDPATVDSTLAAIAGLAEGPVTFSLHRVQMPGTPERTAFLITAARDDFDERLSRVAREFGARILAPALSAETAEDMLVGRPVLHLIREGKHVFLVSAGGYVLVSDSALLLGQTLRRIEREEQGGLAGAQNFRRARMLVEAGAGDGFLYIADMELLPAGRALGVVLAAGVLRKTPEGFYDELILLTGNGGIAETLTEGPSLPTVLADRGREGIWVGGRLTPFGAAAAAMAIFDKRTALRAAWLDSSVTGTFELLALPGKPLVLRLPLKEGADGDAAAKPLGDKAKRIGDALVLSNDPAALAGLSLPAEAEELRSREPQAGQARIHVPARLALLGREGAPGAVSTAFRIRAEDVRIRIRSGLSEAGPVQVIAASLLR